MRQFNTMLSFLKTLSTRRTVIGIGVMFVCMMLMTLVAVPSAHAATKTAQHPASGSGAKVYIHIATASNSAGDYTDLDNNVTNNNPNAVVFVTPNWAPYHVYDNSPIGVWYHGGHWSIFNQNLSAIPHGAAFNVYALPNANYSGIFVHTATAFNSAGDYTDIYNSASNNNPNVLLLVTPNWAPYHVYDNHPIGVWYHSGHWSIFNQDRTAIPNGASFNVFVVTRNVYSTSLHIANRLNSAGDYTDLNISVTNNNPKAVVFITANWVPYRVYNNHNTGVWFHNGRWSIFNQDYAPIPNRAAFNVLASDAPYPVS